MSPQQVAEAVALRQQGRLIKQIAYEFGVTIDCLTYHLSKAATPMRQRCSPHPMDGQIFAMRANGMSLRSISRSLGVPRSTIEYRLRRAPRKTFRDLQAEDQGAVRA